jgi:hypothetical protein
MKRLLTVVAFFIASSTLAQDILSSEYNTAVGGKISSGVAFSYKQFVTPTNALEAQAMAYKEGIRLVGLYQFHSYNIEGLNGLAWYIGPGAHLGFVKAKYKAEYNSAVDFGIDGVVGLDYRIPNTPFNLSLDWQPSFGLLGAGLQPQFGGFAIRYVLK